MSLLSPSLLSAVISPCGLTSLRFGPSLSIGDSISFTAAALASTGVQPFPDSILLNDDATVSSVVSIGGTAIADGGSSAYAAPGGGAFTVSSAGVATFAPVSDFQYLRLGSTATSSAIYVTDIGSSARLTVTVTGSLEVAYSLAPEDGGTSLAGDPTGALTEDTTLSLAADTPAYSIDAATVGAVTRVGGAAGVAKLTFPSDADYIGYDYLEAPQIYLFGFALRILIPAGTTAGRIAETTATNGGGYLLEVVGSNLVLTADDGAGTVLTITRAVPAYDELVTVATALSPYGLMLSLSNDNAAAVEAFTEAVGAFNPPTAQTLKIGGAGAEVYGGPMFHPYVLTEAGLVTLMDEVTTAYSGAVDPTAEMTLTETWFSGISYSSLMPAVQLLTAKLYVTRGDSDFGVLIEAGGGANGLYAIIWNDGSVMGQLLMVMGSPGGGYVSTANLAVIATPAPTGDFEVVISGDSVNGLKAALYIDNMLIGVDGLGSGDLAGNSPGGVNQVWTTIPANPPGWTQTGNGQTGMVSSAKIYVDQATAAVAL
jgi:hypothetical protein